MAHTRYPANQNCILRNKSCGRRTACMQDLLSRPAIMTTGDGIVCTENKRIKKILKEINSAEHSRAPGTANQENPNKISKIKTRRHLQKIIFRDTLNSKSASGAIPINNDNELMELKQILTFHLSPYKIIRVHWNDRNNKRRPA